MLEISPQNQRRLFSANGFCSWPAKIWKTTFILHRRKYWTCIEQNRKEDEQRMSIRRRSLQMKRSRTSLHRIMRRDLQQDPFKIQFVQEITPTDYEQRLNFARQIQERTEERKKIKDYLSSETREYMVLNSCHLPCVIFNNWIKFPFKVLHYYI